MDERTYTYRRSEIDMARDAVDAAEAAVVDGTWERAQAWALIAQAHAHIAHAQAAVEHASYVRASWLP